MEGSRTLTGLRGYEENRKKETTNTGALEALASRE